MDYPEIPQTGLTISTIAGLLIPVVLLLNAARRIPDAEYERTCVTGMIFAASAWLLCTITGLVHRSFDLWAVQIVGLVLALPLIAGAAFFASLGLHSLGVHHRGRGLSFGALSICVLFVIVQVLALVQSFDGRRPALELPGAWKRLPRIAGSTIEAIGKEYSFAVPPPPWVELEPRHIHPESDLVFFHEGKGVFFFVTATPRAPEDVETPADMVKGRQDELRKLDANAIIGDVVPAAAGVVAGLAFPSKLHGKNDVLAFRHWISATPRFAYLLVTWGPATSEKDVDTLSHELLAGFALRK